MNRTPTINWVSRINKVHTVEIYEMTGAVLDYKRYFTNDSH